MDTIKVTCGCGREYQYNRKKRQGHSRTVCNSCMVNRRREQVKARAVEYKGGKCIDCGYNRCMRALGFHHLDPAKKDFSINASEAARSWEVLRSELDKCVLLCACCHMERHDKIQQHLHP